MPKPRPCPLTLAWLALVGLTLASLGLGERAAAAPWLPPLVAAIVWLKGALVARQFIEAHLAHRFIARLVFGFIALAPLGLAAETLFADAIALLASH